MNEYVRHEPNPRRLYRDVENGMISGVCAGLGDYFGISV
jgi:phage shock protein PspC (stress-responsive transcriptional regulator)